MGKVIASITTSVDGYVTGPDDGPKYGLGRGGDTEHGEGHDQRADAALARLESAVDRDCTVVAVRREHVPQARPGGIGRVVMVVPVVRHT